MWPNAARSREGRRGHIRQLRESRGLSKAALARAVGVTWTTLSKWELHGIAPRARYLQGMVGVMKLTAEERSKLFGATVLQGRRWFI